MIIYINSIFIFIYSRDSHKHIHSIPKDKRRSDSRMKGEKHAMTRTSNESTYNNDHNKHKGPSLSL